MITSVQLLARAQERLGAALEARTYSPAQMQLILLRVRATGKTPAAPPGHQVALKEKRWGKMPRFYL